MSLSAILEMAQHLGIGNPAARHSTKTVFRPVPFKWHVVGDFSNGMIFKDSCPQVSNFCPVISNSNLKSVRFTYSSRKANGHNLMALRMRFQSRRLVVNGNWFMPLYYALQHENNCRWRGQDVQTL